VVAFDLTSGIGFGSLPTCVSHISGFLGVLEIPVMQILMPINSYLSFICDCIHKLAISGTLLGPDPTLIPCFNNCSFR
jgi:hypothetical protein